MPHSGDICQIRIDVVAMKMAAPETADPNKGECKNGKVEIKSSENVFKVSILLISVYSVIIRGPKKCSGQNLCAKIIVIFALGRNAGSSSVVW